MMGQRWQIVAENFIGYAIVRDGLVIQADLELADLIGLSWDTARRLCIDRDWSGQLVRNRQRRIHHPPICRHSANWPNRQNTAEKPAT
jgi:hypothetical protein